MRFKWQTILQHGGRMLRARGWCSASRGWAGAADWTHWLMRPVQKRFRNQNTEAGTISSSQKKKKKENKKKKQRARKLGAQCPNLANQCGRAGVGGWGSFAPSCLSHRRQEKEQENKKKAWDAPKKLHVQAELGET